MPKLPQGRKGPGDAAGNPVKPGSDNSSAQGPPQRRDLRFLHRRVTIAGAAAAWYRRALVIAIGTRLSRP